MNWLDNLGKGQAFVGPSTGRPDLLLVLEAKLYNKDLHGNLS